MRHLYHTYTLGILLLMSTGQIYGMLSRPVNFEKLHQELAQYDIQEIILKKHEAESFIKKESPKYRLAHWCADNWKPLIATTVITIPIAVTTQVPAWTYPIIALYSAAGGMGYIANHVYSDYNNYIEQLDRIIQSKEKKME